ncbi:MAG: general stress protein [Tepidanaerobacteraceae bacterium]|jgi:hypothetical protein|nr:general stress protein [Tepidanaerobacteraceae bacterium]
MVKTVIGVFDSREQADKAVSHMRSSGFDTNEISIVAKGGKNGSDGAEGNGNDGDDEDGGTLDMDTIADGTTAGGALGGLAGLALGAGVLAVPGLGPIIAAGPIAGLISGAATGGVAGGLLDMGIPEERGRYYEGEVRKGRILAAVKTHEQKVGNAAAIMRKNGAKDVETH